MQSNHRNTVTLVLGGVRSGKSHYAQQLGERAARVVFVATAQGLATTRCSAKSSATAAAVRNIGKPSRNLCSWRRLSPVTGPAAT